MSEVFKYGGNELLLFHHAKNWKRYFSNKVKPFIGLDVLETGAGIGSSTILLNDRTAKSWLLMEPDSDMAAELKNKIVNGSLPPNCSVQPGTIDNVSGAFDTIIYIDVLEHIKEDKTELKKASQLLKPGGHLVVLCPAFQFLFSPFDEAVGHYRRYNKKMMREITPANLILLRLDYYDSVGFFASLANKLFLRKKKPTQEQVLFWDRWLVPVSKITDKLFLHSFGKSIIAVWKQNNN